MLAYVCTSNLKMICSSNLMFGYTDPDQFDTERQEDLTLKLKKINHISAHYRLIPWIWVLVSEIVGSLVQLVQ